MQPINYRDANFSDLQARLQGQRLRVLNAWRHFGPGTTANTAQAAGISLLTFRPRTTELYQLGALRLVNEDQPGHEGIYAALGDDQIIALFMERQAEAQREEQTLLGI